MIPNAFKLTAYPTLISKGYLKGEIDYITFVASDSQKVVEWKSMNGGKLIKDLTRTLSKAMLTRLREGQIVVFPDFWVPGR